jgi:phosphatidylglycerophosphate synthase
MPVVALQFWLRAQALLWLAALIAIASRVAPGSGVIAAAMGASWLALAVLLRAWRTLADAVTCVRFAGLLAVMLCSGTEHRFGLWGGALAVVLLDLVDGAVAGARGGSPEGAVLDMETDQFTVLGLSVLVVADGGGVHALALPALRYLFVLAMWLLGLPAHDPKPVHGDNRRGRRCCAIVMSLLLCALWPGLAGVVRDAATGLAVLVLAWSFASDARFLVGTWRARRAAS